MFDNVVTRFGPGLNNETTVNGSTNGVFSDLYVPNRISKVHEYPQDFDQFIAADWVNTGAGSAALVAGDGGLLAITSAVSAFQSLQKNPAAWVMQSGFRAWMRIQSRLDSLLGNTIQGLINVTVAPFTTANITDGIWFTTDVTTGEVKGNVAVGGVIQTVDLGVQVVAGTGLATLAWYYDGEVYTAAPNGRVVFDVSGPGVTASARAEIATAVAYPGATALTPTLAVNASTAVARVLTVDQLYLAKDKANINATPAF